MVSGRAQCNKIDAGFQALKEGWDKS